MPYLFQVTCGSFKPLPPTSASKLSVATSSMKKSSSVPKALAEEGSAESSSAASDPKEPDASLLPAVESTTPVMWLCLKCGAQGCGGPGSKSHAISHHKVPRSDLHCIVLCINTWSLWCFDCKSELYVDSYKKLHEIVDVVKKISETKSVTATNCIYLFY